MSRLVQDYGDGIEIWEVSEPHGSDFYVYGVTADPRVCPSLEMARSVAAKAEGR